MSKEDPLNLNPEIEVAFQNSRIGLADPAITSFSLPLNICWKGLPLRFLPSSTTDLHHKATIGEGLMETSVSIGLLLLHQVAFKLVKDMDNEVARAPPLCNVEAKLKRGTRTFTL